jgi:molybdate transport system substrate-binding protein
MSLVNTTGSLTFPAGSVRAPLRVPVLRLLFVFLLVLLASSSAARSQELRVAAAADLQFAMPDLAAQFEKQSGIKLNVTFGSSGNFFSQIQNGAPFDLFFSADVDYPRRLVSAGLADPDTLFAYALGQIVIWAPASSSLNLARDSWNALLDPSVQKIAIANPEHAPYGRAAVAALQKAGLYDRLQSKLVYGENISQAAQFVQSGNAQAGILALSLALSPAMRDGKHRQIPADQHPPIQQAVVVLKSSSHQTQARAFLQFLKTPTARATFSNFGFQVPETAPASLAHH